MYNLLRENWFSHHNHLDRDFDIYSSYADALHNRNPWNWCNYNDRGVGFPRDCGPRGPVGGQWNSWSRNRKVTFCIEQAPCMDENLNFVL